MWTSIFISPRMRMRSATVLVANGAFRRILLVAVYGLVVTLSLLTTSKALAQESGASTANEGENATSQAPVAPQPYQFRLTDEGRDYPTRIRKYLKRIPLWADEGFLEFCLRVRWTARFSKDPALIPLRNATEEIRDRLRGRSLALQLSTRELMPVLMARWSSSYRRRERQVLLAKINRYALAPTKFRGVAQGSIDRLMKDLVWVAKESGATTGLEDNAFIGGRGTSLNRSVLKASLKCKRKHCKQPFDLFAEYLAPEGDFEDWTIKPFGGVRWEGRYWGYGIAQIQAPALALLYALSSLQASGLDLDRDLNLYLLPQYEEGFFMLERFRDQLSPSGLFAGGDFRPTELEGFHVPVQIEARYENVRERFIGNAAWSDSEGGADDAKLIGIQRVLNEDRNRRARLDVDIQAPNEFRAQGLVTRFQVLASKLPEPESKIEVHTMGEGLIRLELSSSRAVRVYDLLAQIFIDYAGLAPGPCTKMFGVLGDLSKRIRESSKVEFRLENIEGGREESCSASLRLIGESTDSLQDFLVQNRSTYLSEEESALRENVILSVQGLEPRDFETRSSTADVISRLERASSIIQDEDVRVRRVKGAGATSWHPHPVRYGHYLDEEMQRAATSRNESMKRSTFDALVERYTLALALLAL